MKNFKGKRTRETRLTPPGAARSLAGFRGSSHCSFRYSTNGRGWVLVAGFRWMHQMVEKWGLMAGFQWMHRGVEVSVLMALFQWMPCPSCLSLQMLQIHCMLRAFVLTSGGEK
ncbi:Nuclear speckle RNA-binding protein like [Actinidia chinensis var. chinensis]|uniref:Nuclear speckle RNA-binding protein like n=1 Tax=Actinidia chinensis var. chinensis TaxID=1590841 RepID=A0A2R6R2L1_ACTCC|nr:Nuclear speckle RNA-binding protein like [Actinidia chinensis var. chinensis]